MLKLSDTQWNAVSTHLPPQKFTKGGRPRANDKRIFEGILWILKNGASWNDLPEEFGSHVTCWRRYQKWQETGVWDELWLSYLKALEQAEQMEWVLAFVNGQFVPQKRGSGV